MHEDEDEEYFTPNLAQLLWDTTSGNSLAAASKPSKCVLRVHAAAAQSTTLSPILSVHQLVGLRCLLLRVNLRVALRVALWVACECRIVESSVACESEGCAEGCAMGCM